jgi:hypothetical protein
MKLPLCFVDLPLHIPSRFGSLSQHVHHFTQQNYPIANANACYHCFVPPVSLALVVAADSEVAATAGWSDKHRAH